MPIPAGPVTISYDYDPLQRLTAADYSTGEFYHYTYDSVGNRLTEITNEDSTTYVYDSANRLTSAGGVTYVFDANGNLLSDGQNSYAYDSANRLTSMNGSSGSFTYGYNGLGDRLVQNGVHYTLDLNTGLTQILSDGTTTYLYGLGRIAQTDGAGNEYFLGDALGSVRQLADDTGTVTLAKFYAPYGETIYSAGAGQTSYGFTGETTDANGLVYLRARYYEPGDGRFLSRDVWEGDYQQPMSYNSWLYVYENPVNLTDSSGYCPGPKNDSDTCWQLLLQIESQYDFIDLQSELTTDNYWTYDELLNIQKDLERFNIASGIGLTTLYPEDVKLQRVRETRISGDIAVCGFTYRFFTKGRPIKIYDTWSDGCLI
ncbi:MAG: RHS repeat-associated core domain-containing protein, partial [Chloroflexota bacterium]